MPLYCIAVLRWCYGSLFVNYYWSEGEWLVLYPFPPLTTLHRFWGNALYLFEMLGEKWEINHSSLGTLYLLSSPAGALSYPNWDEEAHLSLSFPMCRKLGASYRYYKHSVTLLLYGWLTEIKSICALGLFLNQYRLLSPPLSEGLSCLKRLCYTFSTFTRRVPHTSTLISPPWAQWILMSSPPL